MPSHFWEYRHLLPLSEMRHPLASSSFVIINHSGADRFQKVNRSERLGCPAWLRIIHSDTRLSPRSSAPYRFSPPSIPHLTSTRSCPLASRSRLNLAPPLPFISAISSSTVFSFPSCVRISSSAPIGTAPFVRLCLMLLSKIYQHIVEPGLENVDRPWAFPPVIPSDGRIRSPSRHAISTIHTLLFLTPPRFNSVLQSTNLAISSMPFARYPNANLFATKSLLLHRGLVV
ncbi:hypothetical protein BGZ63DRAFT_192575 [Mariannaea sp. PMI_226]|nr:hypothetical protein BGZ63DRAFT_192575 [Mariannaea sp. PMI_226]